MTPSSFAPAVKPPRTGAIAIASIAGGGATHTSLDVASALSPDERVAVVDTSDAGDALDFAGVFTFDHWPLRAEEGFLPGRFTTAIRHAVARGYGALVIDNLSVEWEALLDEVGRRTLAGEDRNVVWGDLGGEHSTLLATARTAPLHVVLVVRLKEEHVIDHAALTARRIGMAPIQRDDIRRHVQLFGELDLEHTLTVANVTYMPGLETGQRIHMPAEPFALIEPLKAYLGHPDPVTTWGTRITAAVKLMSEEQQFRFAELRKKENLPARGDLDDLDTARTMHAYAVEILDETVPLPPGQGDADAA